MKQGRSKEVSGVAPEAGRRPPRRAEQQRAVETRTQIIGAAISEFAEKGYDAASIRSIADRIGVQHPIITYHFRSKDALWRAAAEQAFAQIRADWERTVPEGAAHSPFDCLRHEYRALFHYTVLYPQFHRFLRQETQTDNPRLRWVAEMVITPLLDRLLPQIALAQEQGLLPRVDPIVFHYMMVSLTTTLSSFGPEMEATSGIAPCDTTLAEAYWQLVDSTVFGNGTAKIEKLRKASRLVIT